MPRLRAFLFYLGIVLITFIMAPVCLLILPLPYPKRFRIAGTWTRFNLWTLRVLCKVDAEIHGKERIPKPPFIILCKHQSVWETLALQMFLPPHTWVLKRELLWIPIYGWGMATLVPIAINRGTAMSALKQIVKQGGKRLHRGICVVIFPEGTRTRPGERRKYHSSGGLLSQKTGFPIVPMAHNAGYFWPRNTFIKRPGTIKMVIGPPIFPKQKTPAEITAEAEEWIETTVAGLPRPPQ